MSLGLVLSFVKKSAWFSLDSTRLRLTSDLSRNHPTQDCRASMCFSLERCALPLEKAIAVVLSTLISSGNPIESPFSSAMCERCNTSVNATLAA